MLQRQAVQELHHDEWMIVLSPDFMDSANIGVIQGGCGLRLSLKTGQRLRILGHVIGQELESNKAVQVDIFRFVHHPHPTTA